MNSFNGIELTDYERRWLSRVYWRWQAYGNRQKKTLTALIARGLVEQVEGYALCRITPAGKAWFEAYRTSIYEAWAVRRQRGNQLQ